MVLRRRGRRVASAGTAVSGATSELASSALFTGCRRVPGVVRGVRMRVVRVGQPADACAPPQRRAVWAALQSCWG